MALEHIVEAEMNERLIVLNDIHVPFEDKQSLDAVYRGMRDMKPDKIILAGDIFDFYSISRFEKDPRKRVDLGDELGEAKRFLRDFRRRFKQPEIFYMRGNHEDRLQKYVLANAAQLAWVEGLELANLLDLEEEDIQLVDKRWFEYRGVIISHMNRSNKYGGYTAKNIGMDVGKPLVHTHSHKVGHVSIGEGRDFYDNGCLCQLQADYLESPSNWTQAFMVVDYVDNKPHFTQIQLDNHKFTWNGKLYTPNGTRPIRPKKKQVRQTKKKR